MAMTFFRLAFFAVATFGFVVLYDCGPANFPRNADAEFHALIRWVGGDGYGH